MTEQSNNQRIAKNTLFLYFRMILIMLITLYTSRVVLNVLGVEDYGIYNVVGGAIAFLGFISNAMSVAVQRYISYDLGRGDNVKLNMTFSMSFWIHVILAFIIVAIAETVGLHFFENYMKIPEARMNAALFIYHVCVISAAIRIIQVPYNALIISFERMSIFAVLSIIEAILSLVIVWILQIFNVDKLELYGLLMLLVSFVIVGSYYLYCTVKIPEVKLRFVWDKKIFSELFSFALFNSIERFSWAGAFQGVNIILNMFFGPTVNAARGISQQVLGAVNRFVQNFQVAVTPQITKYYASGEKDKMSNIVFRSTNFSVFLLTFLSLPIICRTDYIIEIWLGQIPEYVSVFCKIVLINAILDSVSNLMSASIKATGKIRLYEIVNSIVLFFNMPLSYFVLKLGYSPVYTYVVYSIVSCATIFVNLYFANKLAGINLKDFVVKTLLPIMKVLFVILPIPLIANYYIPNNFVGFVLQTLICVIVSSIGVMFLGMNKKERTFIFEKIVKR